MPDRTRKWSWVATLCLALAVLAALAAAVSGFGVRMTWWPFGTGFSILRWAAYGGLAAVGLSLAACAVVARPTGTRRGLGLAAAGIVIGVVTFSVPWTQLSTARTMPGIHDITTDMEHPPRFVAVLPLRAKARNPAAYGGPKIAAQQRRAYPDIRPLMLALPPQDAFVAVERVARDLGWRIVATVPAEGRIEATDTTFWYGFKDDIVIRIGASGAGSRVDIRSVSRVGKNDVSKNAARIRKFLAALAAAQ